MSNKADPTGFGKFVPGFDFLQKLAQGGQASMAQWVAPSMDPQALDKRIDELKAVQFWLDQNAAALKATIQALEVQKMTLATLKGMNLTMPPAAAWMPAAPVAPKAPAAEPPPAPVRKPRAARGTPKAATADKASVSGNPDPLQFWGALTRQFQQIAADAMRDVAARSAQAPAAAKAAPPAAPAKKAAPRSRKS